MVMIGDRDGGVKAKTGRMFILVGYLLVCSCC
jgi:hypothetical protein